MKPAEETTNFFCSILDGLSGLEIPCERLLLEEEVSTRKTEEQSLVKM